MADDRHHAQTNASPATFLIHCPHCGQSLQIGAASPLDSTATARVSEQADTPFAVNFRRLLALAQRGRSGANAAAQAQSPAVQARTVSSAMRHHWPLFATLVAGMMLLYVGLMGWGDQVQLRLESHASVPSATSVITAPLAEVEQVDDTTRAAILDTLTQYNRAETEAAALLSVTPLQPLLAPGSALTERRAAEIAERQRQNAPHRTMLLRWAVGEVTVSGDTATVVTQETWSNQETNAIAPEQATVRVTYTLTWDDAAGRWLLAQSEQTPL